MHRASTNGPIGNDMGRDASGRFTVGNRGGPGNPHARKVARLRSALLRAVKPDDVLAIITALVKRAKAGDVAAAREILDRALGKPEAKPLVQVQLDQAVQVNQLDTRPELPPDKAADLEKFNAMLIRMLEAADREAVEMERETAAARTLPA